MSTRYSNLKKSFKSSLRPLLTAFSKQDVETAFPTFSSAEKESLYQIFLQVVWSLHENIEVYLKSLGDKVRNLNAVPIIFFDKILKEEFEEICKATEVGNILDATENLAEEQSLDILSKEKTNLGEVRETLSQAKKDELHYLSSLLEKCEKQNKMMKDRIASLRKRQEPSTSQDAIQQFRSWNSDLEDSLAADRIVAQS